MTKPTLGMAMIMAFFSAFAPQLARAQTSSGTNIYMNDNTHSFLAGSGWTFNSGVYTILNGANVTVRGSNHTLLFPTSTILVVDDNATATITMDGADITGPNNFTNGCPLRLGTNAKLTLNLAANSTNTLTAVYERGAIEVTGFRNAELIINGPGKLIAKGANRQTSQGFYYGSAGIGGGWGDDNGKVTINGGDIEATGGYLCAGIGGGGNDMYNQNGSPGSIIITGGTVTAYGGSGACGIGAGKAASYLGRNGTITISGGQVTATGGTSGHGIGGLACTIEISGGVVKAIGGSSGNGISTYYTIEGPHLGAIKISGNSTTVEAIAGAAGYTAIYTENTNFSISPISPATSYVYWRNATHTDPGGAGALWPSSAPRYLPDDNDKYVKIQIPGPLTHNVSLSPTGTYAFSNEAYGYDPVTPQMVTVTNTGSDATGILTVTLGGVNPSSFLCSTTTIANLAVYGNTGSFTVKPVDGLGVGTYTAIATVTGSNAISASLDLSFTVREADIGSVAILVTDPVPGESPNATATGTGNVSMGTVSWNPGHDPFQGSTPYTATVTLTAHTGYTFSGLTSATINGETATVTDNTGDKVTLSYTFGATTAATLTAISIETQPAKLTYSFGETLDLTGLSVKLQYNDATSKVVPFSNFGTNSISVSPAQGTLLTLLHNGTVVGVSSGIFSANTNPLTVNAASITNVVVTVTEPVAGGTPNETATGVGNFSIGQVTWTPNDLSFGYNISYTATVTLTAQNGYTFTGLTSATINGETATVTGNTGDKVTLSCAFESIQSLIPVFDGLLESYGTGASVPLKVKGFRWEKFTVFRINGADVSTHPLFVPQIPGVYLIEACSAGGSLQLWKYVTVY